jgi:hypothetical protein
MPMNTPLVAVTSGTVTHYKNSSAGTVVYLKGDDGNKYSYFHLNTRVARNGQRVQAGQVIAYSGDSGNSSAPHLHFEVWVKGKKVDPRYFLSQTRTPGSAPDPRLAKEEEYFGGDQAQPGGVPEIDLFGENQFQTDLASIFSGVDYTNPNRPYGQWADELRRLQGELAQEGFAKSPRKLKAHEAVRRLISGMSAMVQRDGYTSKFGDQGGGGGKVSSQGENVVTVPEEEV